MIEKMRKPTKSKNFINYVMYVIIFGMIIGSFVLMIPGLGGGGVQSASDAAVIGSSSISRRDYLDQVKQLESQYSKMFNGDIPDFMRKRVKQSAIEGLVRTEVLSDYAEKEGFVVANDEVGYMLKEVPAFQEDGEFSRDRYDNYLSYVGKSAAQFEAKLMKQMTAQRLNEYFSQGLMNAPQEADLKESADSMSLEFEYIELSPSSLKSIVDVTNDEVSAVLATEEGLKQVEDFYPRVKSDFKEKESVRVSQILLDSESKEKADELRAKLTKDNFAQLAKENSIDPVTKTKGGDLGFIKKGDFALEIEKAAFSMKKDEVSDPIKTKEGYAILLIGEKREASDADFNTVKDKVAKIYLKSEKAKKVSKELTELVATKNFEALKTLTKKNDLNWKNPGKFSLSDKSLPGIGDSKEIEEALFSLKEDGDIYPEVLSHQGNEYLVRRLKVNTVDSADDKKQPNLRQSNRGQNLIQDLFKKHREDLNVKVNPSLFES